MISLMNGESPKSTGELVRMALESISELVRSEVELAKLEMRASVARAGAGGGLLAGAVVFVLFAFAFLLVTLAFLLAKFMPVWAAALVVAILLLAGAAILALAGREKLRNVEIRPTAAIDNVKSDFEMIRDEVRKQKESRTNGS